MNVQLVRVNSAVEMVREPMLRPEGQCTHMMALNLDPRPGSSQGVVRCIDSREGRVHIPGFVDRSVIYTVEMESLYEAHIRSEIEIEATEAVLSGIEEYGEFEFLGLEDPILWRDPEGTLHLYCTIPFYDPDSGGSLYLGHASGSDVHSLEMQQPVLGPEPGVHEGSKEPAIAPRTTAGHRRNLVESTDSVDGTDYSVLRSVTARDPSGPWEYEGVVLHPDRAGKEWCAGHVSPGPLLPRSFVDVGEGLRVGLLNGRETERWHGDTLGFGAFTVGLMLYDFEAGTVEWISEEPLFRDPEAHTITFASEFRQTDPNHGLLYGHVDDSFIRVYRIDGSALEAFLPD